MFVNLSIFNKKPTLERDQLNTLWTTEMDSGTEALCIRYRENLPQRLAAIKTSLEANNLTEAELLSHRLAGANLFGLPEVGTSAKALERAIQSGDPHEISQCFSELSRICLTSVDS